MPDILPPKTLSDPADQYHILVVDDDDRIRDLVAKYLMKHDFLVTTAEDAKTAKEILERFEYDLIVLDIMMPGQTGLELTEELRLKSSIPVLLLTALTETDDRINGLMTGADDYLSKPFDPKELLLRIHAILKRQPKLKTQKEILKMGPWRFDPDYNELVSDEAQVKLTDTEVLLLKSLGEKAGELVGRDELSETCGQDPTKRTIDVQVTRLRRKLEEDSDNPRYLQTVRGKGYLLRAEKIDVEQ